jgi:hypothetical protein
VFPWDKAAKQRDYRRKKVREFEFALHLEERCGTVSTKAWHMEDQSIKQSIITEGSKTENEHLRLNFVEFLFLRCSICSEALPVCGERWLRQLDRYTVFLV